MALTESDYLDDIVSYELENNQSREQVVIDNGADLAVGAVLGKITKSTPTTGTAGTNTGAGTCTAVTAGALAQLGTYTLTCIAEAAGAGTFAVKAPDGSALPDATVGVAYTNAQINFTLNDVGEDFDIGDTFTIAVAAGSGKCMAISFSAVTGLQDAYGILTADAAAASAEVAAVAVVRDAQIRTDNLVWPAGATSDQKAAALAQLKAVGIVERTEV